MPPVEKDLKEGQRWEFDAAVTDAFDDMLARSIPQYETMRSLVTDIAARTHRHNPLGSIVDLGSSRGEAIAALTTLLAPETNFYALEHSPPMLDALRQRFEHAPNIEVVDHDLRMPIWPVVASVVLSVLTLQFVPINYRQGIVQSVYRMLVPGGAFIVVEKVLGETAAIDAMMVEQYHELKGANGYGQEEIERKRMSLEGVLVPVTARWNLDLLRQAGFREVDCFWRWANFAGFVAFK